MPDPSQTVHISEIEELRRLTPRRRGRPRKFEEPTVTTTVRLTQKDHEWVLKERLEFSPLLRAKIHQLQKLQLEGQPDPRSEFVKAARAAGFSDQRVGELLNEMAGVTGTPPSG